MKPLLWQLEMFQGAILISLNKEIIMPNLDEVCQRAIDDAIAEQHECTWIYKKSKKIKKKSNKAIKKTKCGKYKHDFSYKGKKTLSQICCKKCGLNMVKWVDRIRKEIDKSDYS